ncbi:MHYT domain-containing protein [Streptomyces jumonjinensis]|uniref:MHYT domain-containing protein n=1 Tax=Streptomyces jumonjinensis TaxID=1945 RepID=UPI0037BD7AD3
MQGTLDGFTYGLVTPVTAFLMACLGSALGLRCTTRSLRTESSFKPGWLALGATSIGSGIWTMHFIAMMGFSIDGAPITYDRPITFASLGVAIVMVGIGVFIVGYRGATVMALVTGGTITGLGVATMHYLGMAAMRFQGRIDYSTPIVVLSVVIAVVAATAALWAAVSVHGFMASLGASLVMGVAVTGMHYTGMASVSAHLHDSIGAASSGDSPTTLLIPMLLGPAVFLLLAGVVVMFDPLLVMGEPEWQGSGRKARREPVAPAPQAATPLYGQWHAGGQADGSGQWYTGGPADGSGQWHAGGQTGGSGQWHAGGQTGGSGQWHAGGPTDGAGRRDQPYSDSW